MVSQVPHLKLLGRLAMMKLGLTDLTRHFKDNVSHMPDYSIGQVVANSSQSTLQKACEQLCQDFPDLFRPELGCLKDFKFCLRGGENRN